MCLALQVELGRGPVVHCNRCRILRGEHCHGEARFFKRKGMNRMYILCSAIAFFLLAYLLVAMLKPEWF